MTIVTMTNDYEEEENSLENSFLSPCSGKKTTN